MDRKIVQIAASMIRVGEIDAPILYALCEGGTVWYKAAQLGLETKPWTQIEPIKQEEPIQGGRPPALPVSGPGRR